MREDRFRETTLLDGFPTRINAELPYGELRDDLRIFHGRADPYETDRWLVVSTFGKVLASCTTVEAAKAAWQLMSGMAARNLWASRQGSREV